MSHTQSTDELARACAMHLLASDAASQKVGIEITHAAPGQSDATMTVTAEMVNGLDTTHGGYLFLLADSAFAFACNSHNIVTFAQHCTITYIEPGALGDHLTARAREVSRRGRSGIYDVTVSRADGTILAQFRGHSRSIGRPVLPEATGLSAPVHTEASPPEIPC